MVKIAAAVLAADFGRLGEQVREAEAAGVDGIHVDVVDGHFAPILTAGPAVVQGIRKHTSLPIDVHLMVDHELPYLAPFAEAGADVITIHLESRDDAVESFRRIRHLGKRTGLAVTPGTIFAAAAPHLHDVDVLVVMTRNPGSAGQPFQSAALGKLKQARAYLDKRGWTADVMADGGIQAANVGDVVRAGATWVVAGSAIFGGDVRERAATLRAAVPP